METFKTCQHFCMRLLKWTCFLKCLFQGLLCMYLISLSLRRFVKFKCIPVHVWFCCCFWGFFLFFLGGRAVTQRFCFINITTFIFCHFYLFLSISFTLKYPFSLQPSFCCHALTCSCQNVSYCQNVCGFVP